MLIESSLDACCVIWLAQQGKVHVRQSDVPYPACRNSSTTSCEASYSVEGLPWEPGCGMLACKAPRLGGAGAPARVSLFHWSVDTLQDQQSDEGM